MNKGSTGFKGKSPLPPFAKGGTLGHAHYFVATTPLLPEFSDSQKGGTSGLLQRFVESCTEFFSVL